MSESTVKINAIVVRAKDSGENDRLLTLLSPEMGKLSVSAKGVKSLKHKSRSACMPLAYSSFVLKKIKDGLYSLSSADLIESFSSLSKDVELLSYGAYFADLARLCVQSSVPADEEVRLLLNTLYVLTKRTDAAPLIKAVFELKLMELCGIMPEFDSECPCSSPAKFFCPSEGEVRCGEHKTPDAIPISPNEINLSLYITSSSLKDALFAVCNMDTAASLSRITEPFLSYHLGNLPNSLAFLRKIVIKIQ
ncbi:MAG: DNA repair protein RecO [Clostridia bacterium]|nr:DNA repair protein RecO [Clostridia bacterium]